MVGSWQGKTHLRPPLIQAIVAETRRKAGVSQPYSNCHQKWRFEGENHRTILGRPWKHMIFWNRWFCPPSYFKWLRHALHHTSMIVNIGLAMWDGENLISYWTWFQIIPHPDWTTMFAQPSHTSSAAAGDVATLPGFGQQCVVLCTSGSEWWGTFRPAEGGGVIIATAGKCPK